MLTMAVPMVIVPCRAAPLFAATENTTVAFPLPLGGD